MTHLKLTTSAKTLFPNKVMVTRKGEPRISLSSLEDPVQLLMVIIYGIVNSYSAEEES